MNQESRKRGKGISEIEGKAARVAASESGDERVSNEENSCVPAFLIKLSVSHLC